MRQCVQNKSGLLWHTADNGSFCGTLLRPQEGKKGKEDITVKTYLNDVLGGVPGQYATENPEDTLGIGYPLDF